MNNNLLKGFKEKFYLKKKNVMAIIYFALITILSILTYTTYKEYKNTVIAQQQQQMLGTSKSICRSIKLFIDDISKGIKAIALDKNFIEEVSYMGKNKAVNEKLKAYYESRKTEIDSIVFFDKNSKPLIMYPKKSLNEENNVKADITKVFKEKKAYIGKAYLEEDGSSFILNIYEPVLKNNECVGVVMAAIRLETIYNKLIAPVKIGQKGYAMVKDEKGIIIMHPVKKQVGMDVIDSRKKLYPNLYYKELEKLIDDQLKGKEGTAVYYSYWWPDNSLKKVKKLNAYSPVHLGDYFWVIAVTMSYDEVQAPITRFLWIIIGIVSLIAIIIYIFISALAKADKNKKELEKETKYLKMLNEASNELRKKEAELNHAEKLKMIGTLAGGIAHDINNLLTPILGYSELLLMQIPKEGEFYEEIDEIYKASQKGKELIEQILTFSRSDNKNLKVEKININKVTREAVKLIKTIMPKNVVIRENIENPCGYINANFTQIHQVIFNLCTNAYQAIKNNNGVIEISLDIVTKKANMEENEYINYAELTVKDNGCGMDEKTKERIFDPFFTTKDVGEGTGLGLSIIQGIVNKYRGFITVESKEGAGSCFKVYFPLACSSEAVYEIKESENTEQQLPVQKRILVVDDNKDVLKTIKKGLKFLGYKVITETDSEKALEVFKKDLNNIDLVITDYRMPKLKGNELAALIKEIKKDVPLILITGFMEEDEEIIKQNKTIDVVIPKPIEIKKLSQIINKLLVNAV